MRILLEALAELGMPVVFTHPNTDPGGRAMREELEAWRGQPFLWIVPNLGSARYLNLVRHAAAVIGNSSSGLFDTPSLKVPAINVGTRQSKRLRADNVIDVGFDKRDIVAAVRRALLDPDFRGRLAQTRNPYGDGKAAARTASVLKSLKLGPELTAKWRCAPGPFLTTVIDGI
jgi:UDP-N-acetylglucosamine 2-epimerase (non-hydrolysing)/GDP/UDP-N,N'-diacetylbacillosamine 2-epimerase (hydrolysing)